VPPGVSDAERQECEAFARTEAEQAASAVPSRAGEYAREAGGGIIIISGGAGILFAPAAVLVGAIVGSAQTTRERTKSRATQYTIAMDQCLKPVLLAQRLGAAHPDVAEALLSLAWAYGAQGQRDTAKALVQRAEPLLRQALEACEQALGPDHLDIAAALDRMASVLRREGRQLEAADLEARANAIREVAARLVTPDSYDFGVVSRGLKSAPGRFVLTNRTRTILHVRATIVDVASAGAFSLTHDGCEHPVGVEGTCILELEFAPVGPSDAPLALLELHIREIGVLKLRLDGTAR
jgi:tetratricopeptide (TPR) repeat protein